MEYYRGVVSPVLDRLDSETMHVAARDSLHLAETIPGGLRFLEQFTYGRKRFTDPRLNVVVGGVSLDNPVMVGAGWDKKGVAVKGLYALGFSGVEVGSVLMSPQPGNDKPRQFYNPEGVALNRLGFNSPGMIEVGLNLIKYKNDKIPLGISLGKNKNVEPKDAPNVHAQVVSCLQNWPTEFDPDTNRISRTLGDQISYYTINVSSPNTPGLRELQDKGPLTDIVQEVIGTIKMFGGNQSLFVKIAPDLTYEAIDDVIEVIVDNNLAGIVACNTTIDENLKARYGWRNEAGGLSGDDTDYADKVNRIIARIYREAGDKLDIIGVGGVNDYNSTISKIGAGAKAVQVVTGIRQIGPTLPGRINREIIRTMDNLGYNSLSEWVGQEAHTYSR